MAACPIASEAALDLEATEFVGVPSLDGSTANLWRAAEAEILGRFPAFSVHDAVALRDRVWLSGGPEEDPPRRVPLHRYLRSLAASYLETETRMRFQPVSDEHRESGRARVCTCPAPPRQGMYFEDRRGRYGPESTRQPCWNGTGTLVEQALVDQPRQHLSLLLRHVGAREVLADGRLGDAAAFDDAAFFVAIQCFVG